MNAENTHIGTVCAMVIIGAVAVVTALFWPDAQGFEVRNQDTNQYSCVEIIPYAGDHRIAYCTTAEECNAICAEARSAK